MYVPKNAKSLTWFTCTKCTCMHILPYKCIAAQTILDKKSGTNLPRVRLKWDLSGSQISLSPAPPTSMLAPRKLIQIQFCSTLNGGAGVLSHLFLSRIVWMTVHMYGNIWLCPSEVRYVQFFSDTFRQLLGTFWETWVGNLQLRNLHLMSVR